MTFSIVGRCERTGAFGVAISSSSPAVASRCAYVKAGVGAVATQNVTDPRLGPALLAQLESGHSAVDAMGIVSGNAHFPEYRQLTAVGADGSTAVFSGANSLGINGDAVGRDCVAAGNMLATLDVLSQMVAAFEADPSQALEHRLVAALEAGLAAGGEAGPVHSAGLLAADTAEWPSTNLRVDWSDNPISELRSLWELWAPQKDAYVTRALNPSDAPSYGVPGDDR
jgi:uncharacterized Ntn-hydrolase superfamily protein